jgi:hypothetical protein
MNRREAIQRAALLVGGTISVPTILSVLESCARKAGPDWKPAALSGEELAVVSTVADILLPRTDTPGALDVGVPAFIDTLLKEAYLPEERSHFLEGLREFDAAARRSAGKPFVELDPQAQRLLVQQFQEAAVAEARAAQDREQEEVVRELKSAEPLAQRTELAPATRKRPFILTTRQLTLLGFFTSRPGATEVLQYAPIPGAYHGCLPVGQAGNGRRWAT